MTDSKKQRRQYLFWGGGVIFTIAWTIYVFSRESISLDALNGLDPNEFGDFFAGFAAPIAFFWFVLGILLQGKELGLQYEELTKSVEQQKNHAKTAEKNLEIETHNTIIRTCEFYTAQMAGVAAQLFFNTTSYGEDDQRRFWDSYSMGDKDVFFAALVTILGGERAARITRARIINGDGNYSLLATRYVDLYKFFMKRLETLFADLEDSEGLIASYKLGTTGKLYDFLTHALDDKVK